MQTNYVIDCFFLCFCIFFFSRKKQQQNKNVGLAQNACGCLSSPTLSAVRTIRRDGRDSGSPCPFFLLPCTATTFRIHTNTLQLENLLYKASSSKKLSRERKKLGEEKNQRKIEGESGLMDRTVVSCFAVSCRVRWNQAH